MKSGMQNSVMSEKNVQLMCYLALLERGKSWHHALVWLNSMYYTLRII